MTIEILPAQLANQIAAGEVVERPASVIKELVENSLDAGASQIHIEVEKGGTKKLRISDNGSGIAKNELALALSRHATSKIKNLRDLEAISSLGFRGEALASISSVSRLTLTSKPAAQETAWQASAAGRDMEVKVQPAAHPDGTTIEVKDLFFNTPARRKFLRTDKTEFTHIDEVVRRIALARFDVTFILTHNGKIVRQYRAAKDKSQYAKRVAMVCGKAFIEHAVEVDCHHDTLHLWGWLAKPSFHRSQNDLCYSYVNGRMMRDKLINHAIRQSFAERLVGDNHPAFVLFLSLDYREVDVNVHPAKHEVRFHQARFIHDFIYSVCNGALTEAQNLDFKTLETSEVNNSENLTSSLASSLTKHSAGTAAYEISTEQRGGQNQAYRQRDDYVTPLRSINDGNSSRQAFTQANYNSSAKPSQQANSAYQQLMTTVEDNLSEKSLAGELLVAEEEIKLLQFVAPSYGVILFEGELRLLSLISFAEKMYFNEVKERWQQGMVSQPLLLPISLNLDRAQFTFVDKYSTSFEQAGIVIVCKTGNKVQIRQFPARLRDKNITESFTIIINYLMPLSVERELEDVDWYQSFAKVLAAQEYHQQGAQSLINQGCKLFKEQLALQLRLNSVVVDLTSTISQLNSTTE
ncbi:MAG: DNA mismatch repair endonuclease MutL [Colwellia sp.]|nr:DNA mismatch repair endonuclease MutL [Colwellia sp.]